MSGDIETVTTVLPDLDREAFDADRIQTVRPALANLNREQLEALDDFRVNGLEDRRALLLWLLKLQYRTLGRLPDYWYTHIATDATALAVVLTGAERASYGAMQKTRVTPAEARRFRRRIVATQIRPRCREAFRELRTKATEYIAGERPDPEKMAAFAMRPALEEYYQRQRDSLRSFLEGFDSETAVDTWAHELDLATFGVMKDVEPGFDRQLLDEPLAPELYLSAEDPYVGFRENIAATYVLPATNVAVREVSITAGEADDIEREDTAGVEV